MTSNASGVKAPVLEFRRMWSTIHCHQSQVNFNTCKSSMALIDLFENCVFNKNTGNLIIGFKLFVIRIVAIIVYKLFIWKILTLNYIITWNISNHISACKLLDGNVSNHITVQTKGYLIGRVTWNRVSIYKLSELHRNIGNHISVYKLSELHRNTWDHISVYKLSELHMIVWNHISVYKLSVLHRKTWNPLSTNN